MRLPCLCGPIDLGFMPSLTALEKSPPETLSLHLDPLTVSLTAIAGCVVLLALWLTQRQRLAAIESAMNSAKQQGRGRCILAEDPAPASVETARPPTENAEVPREAVPEPIDDEPARYLAERTQPYSVGAEAQLAAACGGDR